MYQLAIFIIIVKLLFIKPSVFSNSLDCILKKVTQQPEWSRYREYQQIKECWQQVVNKTTFKNTRPVGVERGTLYVATASAVWAQELVLQRYSLIKKINSRIDFSLKDIRFSPAKWHDRPLQDNVELPLKAIERQQTPKLQIETAEKSIDAKMAINKWLQNLHQSSQNLIYCPQCQSITTRAELSRWQVCRHCIAQKWHEEASTK